MANSYSVNILGLSKSVHPFDFKLSEEFFKKYGQEVITGGTFAAHVNLDKRETFIEADFEIKGHANLVCDRSLEEFEFPLSIRKQVVFKYGEEAQEVSEEIYIIPSHQDKLELGQLMYEFIALEIPMKKLHPRFRNDENSDTLVYSSANNSEEKPIDPRWEVLKKLK
ncbi:MAG: DUF177 domain-containing protein [Bacteroidetes bacterium]|nr:DUF177 domain-containing protein [Bacteroidota bacterium]